MEDDIKRIIEADIVAQKRLSDATERIEKALKEVQNEKPLVQEQVWTEAKKKLDLETKQLNADFEKHRVESESHYQSVIQSLESNFKAHHDQWVEELFNRSLNEGKQ